MKNKGWVKLYRELFDKPIWCRSTPQQKVILITLILMANHAEQSWVWKGKQFRLQPGQFITSLEGIRKKAGRRVTCRNVRTALTSFEKTYAFLTNETTKTGRLITIVNWQGYQYEDGENDKDTDKQVTNRRQTGDKQVTNKVTTNKKKNKNEENEKNEENVRKEEDAHVGESKCGSRGNENLIFLTLRKAFPILETVFRPKIFTEIQAWLKDAKAAGKDDIEILNALPIIKEILPATTQLWKISDEMQKVLGGTSESTATRALREALKKEGKSDVEIQKAIGKLKGGG